MDYTYKLSDFMMNLSGIYTGSYKIKNSEINEIRNEVLDISITPNKGNDKESLKGDLDNFLKDTKKAYKAVKEETQNG